MCEVRIDPANRLAAFAAARPLTAAAAVGSAACQKAGVLGVEVIDITNAGTSYFSLNHDLESGCRPG